MNYTKGELCSCGFPQSYPIPHEHDRTDREKRIIAYYESINKDMYEALKYSTTIIHNQIRYEVGEHREYLQKQLKTNLEILAKAEEK